MNVESQSHHRVLKSELTHHLIRSKVDGLREITLGQTEDTLDTVVDEREGPRLLPVTPHFDFSRAGENLAAKSSRGLVHESTSECSE